MSDTILTTVPHTEVKVRASFSDDGETATSDKQGVVRDSHGRSYSSGAYEIVEVADE